MVKDAGVRVTCAAELKKIEDDLERRIQGLMKTKAESTNNINATLKKPAVPTAATAALGGPSQLIAPGALKVQLPHKQNYALTVATKATAQPPVVAFSLASSAPAKAQNTKIEVLAVDKKAKPPQNGWENSGFGAEGPGGWGSTTSGDGARDPGRSRNGW
ncbi:uncharacterized protein JN550_001118 [Neoarthrinium moseri]|uniref:uncharacterized protein n=1 Tax=Neoarthrinium moseri TaxID=1658444 RepID=UPI001FDC8456|nr:uncharacterized protein JN550_001118 [Neoarthrinium moseri]KAI1877046.1 hypothetical protein JN550_001118 [Neoarthrinium moseri]